MSVELKNWKELCKEKDERIKELEGKFDLIVEKIENVRDNVQNVDFKNGCNACLVEISRK